MSLYTNKINPSKFEKNQLKFYAYLIPIALFMVLPIIYIFCHAFKPMDELFAFPPQFLVHKPTMDNFKNLFATAKTSGIPASRYAFNSFVVTVAVVVISIVISTMAGFALSKLKFRGKKVLFEVNNIALMFVPVAVTIPLYLTINALGITNTYLAHILPLVAMPVGLFLVKQFIDQIPDSLIEAAYIDGAEEFLIYRKIIIPLIRPAIATTTILAFQSVWNNLQTSQLYVTSDGLKTLTFYMNTLASANNTVAGQGMSAAAALMMFIPNLILFIILQSSVMNTMAHSGLK
nr:carbohydrate ABC transporter permease [uncultured Niameybacter sp.]